MGEKRYQRHTHVHSIKIPKSTIVSDSFLRGHHQNTKRSHTIENNSKMFVSKALCNARRVLLCRGKPCSALLKVMQVPEDLGIEATADITTHVSAISNGVFHR